MTINEISSADWSLSLVNFGEVVQNQSDINQCIQIIVGTTKGSDPLRPTFGCDWEKYIDGPINDTAPNMIREIVDSLTKWEQRIEVTKVEYTIEDEVLKFNILWVLVGNQQKGITQISLDLQPEPDANPAPTSPQLEAPTTLTSDYSYPDGLLEWAYTDTAGVTFQIFRGIDGGAKTQIATVVDDVVYTDSDLLLDSTYQYQVRAKRGSRVSEFSNEAELETLQNVLEFRASMPENFTLTKTGTAAIIQSAAGITKVFCIDGDPETITAFYGDDSGDPDINAGITGTLDLSGLTGMRTVRARNQSFTFIPGTWVQNASVSINLSNSITTAARVTALVDSVIIANGGTTTDDGSNYTGSAGNTFASRILTVGTIELDLGDAENSILYEKIVVLGTKGWTVETVNKTHLAHIELAYKGKTDMLKACFGSSENDTKDHRKISSVEDLKEIFEDAILNQSNLLARVCTIKDAKERKEIFDLVESFFETENKTIKNHSVMWKNLSDRINRQATGKKIN